MKNMNKFYLIIFALIILFNSCESLNNKDLVISSENLSFIEYLLSSKKINIEKKKDSVFLKSYDCKLDTKFSKEMNSSISVLILYDEYTNKFKNSNYNITFKIELLNKKNNYYYSLNELSQVIEGEQVLEGYLNKIINKREKIKDYKLNKYKFAGFSFNKTKDQICYYLILNDDFENITEINLDIFTKKINNISLMQIKGN